MAKLKHLVRYGIIGGITGMIMTIRQAQASSFMDIFKNSALNTAEKANLPGSEFPHGLGQGAILEGIGRYINNLLVFLGIVFFLLIIYGGFLWMTSAGNENKVDKAKKILIASIIGLAIILLGQVIAFLFIELF